MRPVGGQTFDEWQLSAIGVPFVPFGRDYYGWDCYGLVVCAYRDVLGVTLPDFEYKSVKDYDNIAAIFTSQIAPVWRPARGDVMDVACIWRRGRPIHAGLVVGKRRIMHVEHGIETCVEPVTNMRVEGYYVPASCSASPV
jgi:cell wall-associated NlpC family hydrolase